LKWQKRNLRYLTKTGSENLKIAPTSYTLRNVGGSVVPKLVEPIPGAVYALNIISLVGQDAGIVNAHAQKRAGPKPERIFSPLHILKKHLMANGLRSPSNDPRPSPTILRTQHPAKSHLQQVRPHRHAMPVRPREGEETPAAPNATAARRYGA
jgi:hypothetical protein